MAKQKLSGAQIRELRAAYEAWNPHDPNSESADQLAARFGISKQTLYTYRDRWIEEDRRRRQAARDAGAQTSETSEAILFLTIELAKARARIEELETLLESRDRHNVSVGA